MSYATYERSRRSAILPAEIKQLIENTPRKVRNMTTPTELDAALELAVIFQFHVYKPKDNSLLQHIRLDIPPIVRSFYDLHETELRNILKYVRTLGLANAYYALDMDLLDEAAVKYYLWKTEHNFNAEELDLSEISKKYRLSLVRPTPGTPFTRSATCRRVSSARCLLESAVHIDFLPLASLQCLSVDADNPFPTSYSLPLSTCLSETTSTYCLPATQLGCILYRRHSSITLL